MKKLLLILSIGFIGCTNSAPTIEWINNARKPINCEHTGYNFLGYNFYTFIDADGNVYASGSVTMSFPDTIKSLNPPKTP